MGITCVRRVIFLAGFYINNYILHITNYNNNAIAHVHRVTYRGDVPSAHRELVQSTAATSRPTTLQPMSGGRAPHACPSQWEASMPKEPLRGAGLRDA